MVSTPRTAPGSCTNFSVMEGCSWAFRLETRPRGLVGTWKPGQHAGSQAASKQNFNRRRRLTMSSVQQPNVAVSGTGTDLG